MIPTPSYGWQHPEPGDHTRTWEYWDTFADVDRDLKAVEEQAAARTNANERWNRFVSSQTLNVGPGASGYLAWKLSTGVGSDWTVKPNPLYMMPHQVGSYAISGRIRAVQDGTIAGYLQVYFEARTDSGIHIGADYLTQSPLGHTWIDITISTHMVWIDHLDPTQDIWLRVFNSGMNTVTIGAGAASLEIVRHGSQQPGPTVDPTPAPPWNPPEPPGHPPRT